jgi:hypothetical protein
MHPKNKPPIVVPTEFVPEMERLTKAALMDLVWNLGTTINTTGRTHDIEAEVRRRAAFVVTLREQD